MNSRENESVDWLDLGPDPDEGRPPRDPRRRYLWYGAVAAVVVLALLLTRAQHGTNRAAASSGSPSHTTAASSTAPSAASSGQPSPSGSFVNPDVVSSLPGGPPVQVSSAGHRLLNVPADWELFARATHLVIRIQLAQGRITSTVTPDMGSQAPVALLVGADRVIVRPQDDTPGAVVQDGKPATELPEAFRQGMSLLPGPDPKHVWADAGSALALFTLGGRPSGATIDIPSGASVMGSDGAGYALLSGIGGTYLARPGAVHRVTSGLLLATGPTRWLTEECDASLACVTVVTDRASGAQHLTNTPVSPYQLGPGSISPDGRRVALTASDGDVVNEGIDLLDLQTGLHKQVRVTLNPIVSQNGPSFIWSPDSRWLFVIDSSGQVMCIEGSTGRAAPLDVKLPPLTQLAFRDHSG